MTVDFSAPHRYETLFFFMFPAVIATGISFNNHLCRRRRTTFRSLNDKRGDIRSEVHRHFDTEVTQSATGKSGDVPARWNDL
jgi:hypothetical protein